MPSALRRDTWRDRVRDQARDARRDRLRQLPPANRSAHHIDMARLLENFDGIRVWQDEPRVPWQLPYGALSISRQSRREYLRNLPYNRVTDEDFELASCLEEIDGIPVWPRP